MYGGGFATIPAYLSDLFGTRFVSAIHGRLLTAWSAAGVLGPVFVNYIRQYEVDRGVPVELAYDYTMYLMAGLLAIGFVCNALVKPVAERHRMAADDSTLATTAEQPIARGPGPGAGATTAGESRTGLPILATAWAAVGAPLAWGVAGTLSRAMALFER